MSSRAAIVLGLVTGAALVILVAGAIVMLTPPMCARIPPTPPTTGVSSSGPVPSPSAFGSAPSVGSGSPPASPGASATSGAFHVGQPAPPLVLPQVGGGTLDLAGLRGKPVWLYFMATWCPSCEEEIPLMNGLAARYGDRGLVVAAVDVRENEAAVVAFATRMNVVFPVALDSTGAAEQAWGVVGLPVHFWVDAEGIVRDGALGGIGADVMAQGLGTVLPGVTVTP